MLKILFVCHGNICRSPMAEYVMHHLVSRQGLDNFIQVRSVATSREEIGNDAHPGTLRKMQEKGISTWHRQARQMTQQDYRDNDLIILMDENNWQNTMRIIGSDTEEKVFKAMYFANSYSEDNALQQKERKNHSPYSHRQKSSLCCQMVENIHNQQDNLQKKHVFSSVNDLHLSVSEQERRSPRDVRDPWYTGDFEETYRDIKASCEGLLNMLQKRIYEKI